MLAPAAKAMVGAVATERALDLALSGIGVSAALVSASFAGYMVMFGPGGAGGRAEAPSLAAIQPPPRHTVLATAMAASAPSAAAATQGIDFTPTGSISDFDEGADGKVPAPDPTAVLADFAVRDVFDGTALIEARGSLQMVKPGATLQGAGRVLGVGRQGGIWVVSTTGGMIRQRR